MIAVLLKAHSAQPIYQMFQLNIKQEDLVLPMIGSSWDIELAFGYFRCEVARIEPRDSFIMVYSSDENPVKCFDHRGQEIENIWIAQPDGSKLLVLPK